MSHRGDRVKAAILHTGLTLWRQDSAAVSTRRIAMMLGISHGSVLYHYGSADKMRDAIAAYAVRLNDDIVVPQLILSRHPSVDHLSEVERQTALIRAI